MTELCSIDLRPSPCLSRWHWDHLSLHTLLSIPMQPLRPSHVYLYWLYLYWLLVGEPYAWAPLETIGAKSCLPSSLPPTIHCPSPLSSASVPRREMTATHSSLQTAGCLLFLFPTPQTPQTPETPETPQTSLVTVLFASRISSYLHFHVVQGTKVSGLRFQYSKIWDNLSGK